MLNPVLLLAIKGRIVLFFLPALVLLLFTIFMPVVMLGGGLFLLVFRDTYEFL